MKVGWWDWHFRRVPHSLRRGITWSKSDGKMQLNGTFYGYFEVIPWWFNSNPIISMSGIALSIQHNCQREWMYGARLTGSTMTEV